MAKKISDNVYKIVANSNIYVIVSEEVIVIDAGDRKFHRQVKEELEKITGLSKVKKVLLTHMHYDHIGNLDLFPNAEVYAHEDEIADFKKNSFATVLDENLFDKFSRDIELKPLPKDKISGLHIFHTPGHTSGSVCFLLDEPSILFSGDTVFFGRNIGRIDLPTSVPYKMNDSLNEILSVDFDILCPGHDY